MAARIMPAVFLFFFTFFSLPLSLAEAAFEKASSLPGLLLCEVKCYGTVALQERHVEALEGKIAEQLQATKCFRLAYRIAPEDLAKKSNQAYADYIQHQYRHLHLASVIESGDYAKRFYDEGYGEEMNAYAVRYGGPRFPRLAENVFTLGGEELQGAKALAAAHNVQYLLFCNVQHVSAEEFANIVFIAFKGKRVALGIDYYLINAKNGKTFYARSFSDKSANKVRLSGEKSRLTFGKEQDMETLLDTVSTTQAKRIAKTIAENALRQVGDAAIYVKRKNDEDREDED